MKIKFKTALRTAAAVATIAVASSASATAYRWTITENNPDEGGDADIVGTFDFNSADGSYSNWNLTTSTEATAITDERFGARYLPSNSTIGSGQDFQLVFGQRYTFDGPRPEYELTLNFYSPLTSGGTVHGSLFERKWVRDGGTVLQTGDFTATAMPVPEPETLAMSLAGLAAVGGSLLRRRRAAATSR